MDSDIPAVTLTGDETVLAKSAVMEFAESLRGELLAKGGKLKLEGDVYMAEAQSFEDLRSLQNILNLQV